MSRLHNILTLIVVLPAALLMGCKKPAGEHPAAGLQTLYNPRETFAPLTLPTPVNGYRSGDGTPGPDYWQNRADYKIAATLDPASANLSGDEIITYTNNSPSTLDALWVQLDENTYKQDARARFSAGEGRRRRSVEQATDGFVLDAVEIGEGSQAQKADFVVSDTRMQVRLPAPLKAHGGQLRLHIRYHYTVPAGASGRTGHEATKNGENGIRAWRCSTICAAGTRFPIWARNSISNMAMWIMRSPCHGTCWWRARASWSIRTTS
jgi:hypothetical protein